MFWIAKLLTALVAFLHFYFLWLEMFAWTTKGKKVFRNFPKDLFEPSKAMAAYQGLYNGFLAAGLVWAFVAPKPQRHSLRIFFLVCVAAAGLYGWYSVSNTVLFVQALPAALALVLCRLHKD